MSVNVVKATTDSTSDHIAKSKLEIMTVPTKIVPNLKAQP